MVGRLALLALGVCASVLAVAAVETYLSQVASGPESSRAKRSYSNPELFHSDATFGVRPAPSISTKERYLYDGNLIYEVTYTTDSHGLRVGPPVGDVPPELCILFFGGSFVWGQGVENDETLPYQVGVKTAERYSVWNFGFGGYGPHQMLAAVESGFVRRAAPCTPRHVFYLAISEHVNRAVGRTRSQEKGPRFVLRADGTVHRDGNLDEHRPSQARLLESSRLIRTAYDSIMPSPADFNLYYKIVQRTRDLFAAHHPKVEFHVLNWNLNHGQLFGPDIATDGIRVHALDSIMPVVETAEYKIPHDGHPNPRAHELLADYVVRAILDAPES